MEWYEALDIKWYELLGIGFVLGWGWLIWEARNAPLMPDDYDLNIKDEDVDKDLQNRNDEFEDDYENQPFGD